MFATSACCSRWSRVSNSCSRNMMFTLWPFKWTLLLLLVMFLISKVAAKWPPDPHPPIYPQHWPHRYIDDFVIDSGSFGDEKSIDGNGNAVFDKTNADEMTLREVLQQSKVIEAPAEERRQRQLQWLGGWLFGQRQAETRRTQQEWQPMQQQSLLRMQHQQPVQTKGFRIQDADIVVYKKAPEFVPGEEKKSSAEGESDVDSSNHVGETAEKQDTLTDYDYSGDVSTANERFNTEQPPRSKRISLARNLRLDYGYIPYTAYQYDRQKELEEAKKLAVKRNKTGNMDQRTFLPSISAGAMTHLGNFFTDLSKNVHYNEKPLPLSHEEAKLLEGQHPLRELHQKITGGHEANAELLHAIRTYRPSQKIRSLVAMNPRGYHGAQFIDPNYMWVGLGK
ncbi:uncharacterized protein LOC101459685 [Ceratitis capitata]|uniref:uncharacterized protein LOC101459685 n=1 Tax=Ceratitis capitata TaxID=7213 RepID=UPI00061888CF|nr:uncharacterized protein LOC101459685 [Ceratitis capitata]